MKKLLILIGIITWCTHLINGQQCLEDRHSTNITDAWVSCQMSSNSYISLGSTHWILYNFDSVKNLYESTVWNINHPDYLDYGVKRIRVDYSLDKINWTYWGEMNLSQAAGRSDYLGEQGPNFNGIAAKHLLISVLESHGDLTCAGFSEIKINTESSNCPNEIVFEINEDISGTENFQAQNIVAYNTIQNDADVSFIASEGIEFLQGFEIVLGAKLIAYINGCGD